MATISLPDGSIFRVGFPDTITAGEWYLGVLCRDCNVPILSFKVGPSPLQFVGDGKLSIPCPHCPCDAEYGAGDLRRFKAEATVPSFRANRPEPANSPRQPLLPKYNKARVTLGIGAIEQRPEAALIVARCITYWSNVEAATARLLAAVMKANTEPSVAVYLSLQNNRAKRDAMFAAAKAVLSKDELRLFSAVMAFRQSVEKSRNDLAHGIFGYSRDIDGLVWIETSDYLKYAIEMELHKSSAIARANIYAKCFVYEIGTLENIAREIETLEHVINQLSGYLREDSVPIRVPLYGWLSQQPRVRKELDLLDRKNAQEEQ